MYRFGEMIKIMGTCTAEDTCITRTTKLIVVILVTMLVDTFEAVRLVHTSSAAGAGSGLAPALIVFGDSTVDVGMNNKLKSVVRANFLPYGENFLSGKHPTGRFCDGQVPVDYVATFLGLPFPLAYLDPQATGPNIVQGINFASAASGYNDNTAKFFNVISLTQQLQYFKNYQAQLAGMVGSSNASYIISEALYVLSTGSNDYANNYFFNVRLKARMGIQEYTNSLLQSADTFLQELYQMGARKFTVVNIPPLGCLPSQRSLLGARKGDFKDCIQPANDAAFSFNQGLETVIQNLKAKYSDFRIIALDCYGPLLDMYQNPTEYGLEEVRKGCCSSGRVETAILCNPLDGPLSCKDASKFLFWDSFHPTQNVYKVLADTFINITIAANIL